MLTLGIYKPDLIDDKELFNSLRGALQNCIDVLDKKLIELDKKLIDTQER
jgi:hypothetical protein